MTNQKTLTQFRQAARTRSRIWYQQNRERKIEYQKNYYRKKIEQMREYEESLNQSANQ